MKLMRLRPHHLLDVICSYGQDVRFTPHPYGHALHSVAEAVLSNPDLRARFVVGPDEICMPCEHLRADGLCDDVLRQIDPPISKQGYNDDLDRRLFDYLALAPGAVMAIRHFLEMVDKKVPGIEALCTHPKEDEGLRLAGLIKGLLKLGIRRRNDDEEREGC